MFKILKFELAVLEKQTVRLPIGAKIIRVEQQETCHKNWCDDYSCKS